VLVVDLAWNRGAGFQAEFAAYPSVQSRYKLSRNEYLRVVTHSVVYVHYLVSCSAQTAQQLKTNEEREMGCWVLARTRRPQDAVQSKAAVHRWARRESDAQKRVSRQVAKHLPARPRLAAHGPPSHS
jgi:hypothetical protein